MSREIKFRAWTMVDGKMEMLYDDYHRLEIYEWLGNKERDCDFMQFTGLKDKNGKEIYEGDILYHKYWYSPELSGETFEKEENMEVKIPDFFMYLGSDLVENSPDGSVEKFVSYMEIIGNIYEDKHLIDSQNKKDLTK